MQYLVAAIVGAASSLIVLANGFMYLRRRRRADELQLSAARETHLKELARARTELETERSRFAISRHEFEMDGEALVLACQELVTIIDIDTDELVFDGDWQEVRQTLRGMVSKHNKKYNEEHLRLRYPVQIERTD